jgi:hypothetical protein
MKTLPVTMLRQLFAYDNNTGLVSWKIPRKNGVVAGVVAGSVDSTSGYARLCFGRKSYKVHRVVWALAYGEWPVIDIDHINGDKTDNRLENLRLATRAENLRSMKKRKNSLCSLKGVTRYMKNKDRFCAQIRIDGKQRSLGIFDSQQAAHDAYCASAVVAFGKFFNPDCSCHQSGAVVFHGAN